MDNKEVYVFVRNNKTNEKQNQLCLKYIALIL